MHFTSHRPHPRLTLFPRVNHKPLYARIPSGWWYLGAGIVGAAAIGFVGYWFLFGVLQLGEAVGK